MENDVRDIGDRVSFEQKKQDRTRIITTIFSSIAFICLIIILVLIVQLVSSSRSIGKKNASILSNQEKQIELLQGCILPDGTCTETQRKLVEDLSQDILNNVKAINADLLDNFNTNLANELTILDSQEELKAQNERLIRANADLITTGVNVGNQNNKLLQQQDLLIQEIARLRSLIEEFNRGGGEQIVVNPPKPVLCQLFPNISGC